MFDEALPKFVIIVALHASLYRARELRTERRSIVLRHAHIITLDERSGTAGYAIIEDYNTGAGAWYEI